MILTILLSLFNWLLVQPVHAHNVADSMDYNARFGPYNIEGWTDSTQITCGVNNKPDNEQDGYFEIYEQVYDLKIHNPSPSLTINGPTRFWSINYVFTPPKKEPVRLEVKTGPDVNLAFTTMEDLDTHKKKIERVSVDNEGCITSTGCVYEQDNLKMTVVANDLNNTGIIHLLLRKENGDSLGEVTFSRLKDFKSALDKCMNTLLPKLL